MKITKYVHSCLLVEENNTVVLIDPGLYTFQANMLTPAMLSKLDYILITHSHPDHMYIPFIKAFVDAFSNVQIITNQEAKELLQKEGVTATTQEVNAIVMQEIPHEKIFGGTVPQNTQFDIFGKLTHPGDSLHSTQTQNILTLPIQAPWGSTTWAVETAEKLQPKVIIPIHDWHWKDEVKKSMYDRLETYFAQKNISFKKVEDGITIEV